MGEVYLGAFRREGDDVVAVTEEAVVKPETVALPEGNDWLGVGTGFAAAEAALRIRLADRLQSVDPEALPHAAGLACLAAVAFARGEALPPERVEPAYLRNQVALTLAEQAALRAGR